MALNNSTKSTSISRNALLASIVLLAVFAGYNWSIQPQVNFLQAAETYNSNSKHLENKKAIIQQNNLARQEEIAELKKKLKQSEEKIFHQNQADIFMDNLYALVQAVGCKISSLESTQKALNQEKGKSESICVPVPQQASLTVEGGYDNIIVLMHKLQNRPQQVRVDSIEITSTKNNSTRLKCDLNITIYVVNNKEKNLND